MKISVWRKFYISLLMLAGLFASVSAVLRLNCLFNLSKFRDPRDMPAMLWLALTYHFSEVPIGIICCSAPIVPPVSDGMKKLSVVSTVRNVLSVEAESKIDLLEVATPWKKSDYSNREGMYAILGSKSGSKGFEKVASNEIPRRTYALV